MKTLVTTVVAVSVLSILVAGQAHAQDRIVNLKKLPPDLVRSTTPKTKVFTVRYDTRGKWLLAAVYNTNTDIDADRLAAARLQKRLKEPDLEFETKSHVQIKTTWFSSSHKVSVYLKTPRLMTRTFSDVNQAQRFYVYLNQLLGHNRAGDFTLEFKQ